MSVPELDPQIKQVLDDAEAAGLPPVQESTPEQVRANHAASWQKLFPEGDEVHSVEDADACVRSNEGQAWLADFPNFATGGVTVLVTETE